MGERKTFKPLESTQQLTVAHLQWLPHWSLLLAYFPVNWKLSKVLGWPFPEYWDKLAAHHSSFLNSFWLSFTKKRKKWLIISKQFIFLLFQSKIQLRGTSDISVVGDFWGLKWLVEKSIFQGHFFSMDPNAGKLRKKQILNITPLLGLHAGWFSRQDLHLACTVILSCFLSQVLYLTSFPEKCAHFTLLCYLQWQHCLLVKEGHLGI